MKLRLTPRWAAGDCYPEICHKACDKLGAAFLCADLGITPEVRADHAVYLALWVEVRKAVDRTESVDGLREYL
jgi:hypothetical protein